MKRILLVGALSLTPFVAATAAHAAALPKPKAYANCAALNKVYPHGVARAKTVVDSTSGVRVRNFVVDAKTYALNDGRVAPAQYDLDRDNDGIACEKR